MSTKIVPSQSVSQSVKTTTELIELRVCAIEPESRGEENIVKNKITTRVENCDLNRAKKINLAG